MSEEQIKCWACRQMNNADSITCWHCAQSLTDWTYILDADGREIEGALPPVSDDGLTSDFVLLSILDTETGEKAVIEAWYDYQEDFNYWNSLHGNKIEYKLHQRNGLAIPYAYKPWPDPAPWAGENP